MKKILLFISIFVSGLIGAIGWIIANVLLRSGGATSVAGALNGPVADILILLLFVAMSAIGLWLAILEVTEDNNTEIKKEENAQQTQSTPTPATLSIEEIKKYKDLVDMGIISQEEFDAKKKQLLDL